MSYCRLYRGVTAVRCFLQTTSMTAMLPSHKEG
ncbi:unnamed protein product [Schistosoma margrebowiei]|uniref:Uncharacterized protein n=1 Tax=Schistosoma margrebowiei TaxID=48269 RepID=A0A183MY23_9TREM|nr:unnamed protein product [Schistosoma margrebowiei]